MEFIGIGLFIYWMYKKYKRLEKIEVSVLMLGLDNAGKTCISKALLNEDITNVEPTQGFNVKEMQHGKFKMKMWDIGGQKTIRPQWRNFFENTDLLIFVVDSADKRRLEEAGSELASLLDEDHLVGIPLLVYANKQDLVSAVPPEEIVGVLGLMDVKNRTWQIQPSSAKTGQGLSEGVEWMLGEIASQRRLV